MVPIAGIATLDEVLQALSHPRRRSILYYLQDCEVATVDELAEQIVAWETDSWPGKIAEDRRERVASDLIHNHLPKLADTQFVEYDPRSLTVAYTDPPLLLEQTLRLLAHLDRAYAE